MILLLSVDTVLETSSTIEKRKYIVLFSIKILSWKKFISLEAITPKKALQPFADDQVFFSRMKYNYKDEKTLSIFIFIFYPNNMKTCWKIRYSIEVLCGSCKVMNLRELCNLELYGNRFNKLIFQSGNSKSIKCN